MHGERTTNSIVYCRLNEQQQQQLDALIAELTPQLGPPQHSEDGQDTIAPPFDTGVENFLYGAPFPGGIFDGLEQNQPFADLPEQIPGQADLAWLLAQTLEGGSTASLEVPALSGPVVATAAQGEGIAEHALGGSTPPNLHEITRDTLEKSHQVYGEFRP